MRTLSLLILSTVLVTGCGSGGSSDDNIFTDNESSNSDSGPVILGGDSSNSGTSGDNDDSGSNQPDNDPTPPLTGDFTEQMLVAVNTARAQDRDCGGQMMPAVGALTWDYDLEHAAFLHSASMANYDFFDHTGLNGVQLSDRVSEQGYNWYTVGENIAAGQQSMAIVMDGWLKSSGHCKNIMDANYTEMGAASVANTSAQYGIYWTQVFARPR